MFQSRSISPLSITSRGLRPPKASFGVSSQLGMTSSATTSDSLSQKRSSSLMRLSPGSLTGFPLSQSAIARSENPERGANLPVCQVQDSFDTNPDRDRYTRHCRLDGYSKEAKVGQNLVERRVRVEARVDSRKTSGRIPSCSSGLAAATGKKIVSVRVAGRAGAIHDSCPANCARSAPLE